MQRGTPWAKILEALTSAGSNELPERPRPEAKISPASPELGAVGSSERWREVSLKDQREMRDPYGEPIAPIAKAKEAAKEFVSEGAGPYFSAPMNAAIDVAVPETPFDFAALPLSAFTKGGRVLSAPEMERLGSLAPESREMAMKRQNAIQATREQVSGKGYPGFKSGGYIPKDLSLDPTVKALGRGVDMQAYSVPGDVVVKVPRHARASEKVLERLGRKEKLYKAGLAPETFVVETPSGGPRMVQPKAQGTAWDLQKEGVIGERDFGEIRGRMQEEAKDIGLSAADLHDENIARFDDGWKIIDSGHFGGDADKMFRSGKESQRYVAPDTMSPSKWDTADKVQKAQNDRIKYESVPEPVNKAALEAFDKRFPQKKVEDHRVWGDDRASFNERVEAHKKRLAEKAEVERLAQELRSPTPRRAVELKQGRPAGEVVESARRDQMQMAERAAIIDAWRKEHDWGAAIIDAWRKEHDWRGDLWPEVESAIVRDGLRRKRRGSR